MSGIIILSYISEAEYACKKKKNFIPLKMEKDYNPDGWLDFILGVKMYVDFSGTYTFKSRIDDLLKRVRAKLGKDDTDSMIVPEEALSVSSEKVHLFK